MNKYCTTLPTRRRHWRGPKDEGQMTNPTWVISHSHLRNLEQVLRPSDCTWAHIMMQLHRIRRRSRRHRRRSVSLHLISFINSRPKRRR